MMNKKTFCFVLMQLCLFFSANAFFPISKADTYPQDAFLFYGDNLTLWVKLKDAKEHNISEIYLEIDPGHIVLDKTIHNNTHAFVEVQATKEIGGRRTYQWIDRHQMDVMTSTFITVQPRLQIANNISAIWDYHREKIFISLKDSEEYYLVDNNFDLTAVYNPNSSPGSRSKICTITDLTHCVIENYTMHHDVIFLRWTMALKAIKEKKYKETQHFIKESQPPIFSTSSLFQIIPIHGVKPTMTGQLTVKEATSNCITIALPVPLSISFLTLDMKYQMTIVNQENTSDTTVKYAGVPKASLKAPSIPLSYCGLDPATKYALTVKVKPDGNGYWSNSVNIVTTTKEDRPDHAPPLEMTSFFTGPCETRDLREAIVYWNKPAKYYTHGEVIKFGISFWNKNSSMEPPLPNQAYHMIPCDRMVNFRLTTYTKVGASLESSSLAIPSEEETFQLKKNKLDFKVKKLNVDSSKRITNLTCIWDLQHPEEAEDVVAVIYFCEAPKFSTVACADDFQTVEVNLIQKSAALYDIPSKTSRFGYALKKGSQVSGITWIDCVYDPSQKPDKPSKVEATPGSEEKSIFVTWNYHQCTLQHMTLVLKYHVKACPVGYSKEFCKIQEVEGHATSKFLFKGLDEDQTYRITVQAESPAGRGLESEEVQGEPARSYSSDNNPGKTVGIILGVLCLLVLGSLIFLCLRYIYRRQPKIHHMIFDNEDFSYPACMEGKGKDSSSESGVYSNSSRCSDASVPVSEQGDTLAIESETLPKSLVTERKEKKQVFPLESQSPQNFLPSISGAAKLNNDCLNLFKPHSEIDIALSRTKESDFVSEGKTSSGSFLTPSSHSSNPEYMHFGSRNVGSSNSGSSYKSGQCHQASCLPTEVPTFQVQKPVQSIFHDKCLLIDSTTGKSTEFINIDKAENLGMEITRTEESFIPRNTQDFVASPENSFPAADKNAIPSSNSGSISLNSTSSKSASDEKTALNSLYISSSQLTNSDYMRLGLGDVSSGKSESSDKSNLSAGKGTEFTNVENPSDLQNEDMSLTDIKLSYDPENILDFVSSLELTNLPTTSDTSTKTLPTQANEELTSREANLDNPENVGVEMTSTEDSFISRNTQDFVAIPETSLPAADKNAIPSSTSGSISLNSMSSKSASDEKTALNSLYISSSQLTNSDYMRLGSGDVSSGKSESSDKSNLSAGKGTEFTNVENPSDLQNEDMSLTDKKLSYDPENILDFVSSLELTNLPTTSDTSTKTLPTQANEELTSREADLGNGLLSMNSLSKEPSDSTDFKDNRGDGGVSDECVVPSGDSDECVEPSDAQDSETSDTMAQIINFMNQLHPTISTDKAVEENPHESSEETQTSLSSHEDCINDGIERRISEDSGVISPSDDSNNTNPFSSVSSNVQEGLIENIEFLHTNERELENNDSRHPEALSGNDLSQIQDCPLQFRIGESLNAPYSSPEYVDPRCLSTIKNPTV